MRSINLRRLAVCLAGGLVMMAQVSSAEPSPNFLFIFADDHCFEAIHETGISEIQTPNLDRLAREGTVFERAYNQGSWSGAVCLASRCMLITGRNLWHANRVFGSMNPEREAGRVWPKYLEGAGYRTYMTGKWHVQTPAEQCFNVVRNVRGGMPNQTPEGYNRPLPGVPDPWSPYDPRFEGFWKGGKHWSAVVADDAVEFMAEAQGRKNPFFMYIAFNAPHDPRQAPKEYVDRYPLDKVSVPGNFLAEYPYKEGIGCGEKLRDEALGPFPRTEHAVKVHRQEYFASITYMDAQIGRILEALDQSGKRENTYIFFTADHGLAVGHHGLMGKQNLYEHSVRVPFMVVGPGVEAGRRIDTPIYLQQVMPTTLDLASVPQPDHVDFRSLVPLLRGKSPGNDRPIYGAYLNLQRMVTEGGYKLILYPALGKIRLYHLDSDPEERFDIADDVSSFPIIQRLFRSLLALQKETGDTLDLIGVYPQL